MAAMKVRNLLQRFYQSIHDYNLFIPEDDEYDDDEPEDLAKIVRRQRYATRIYIPLLITTLYVLFFIALVMPQDRMVTILNIDPSLFDRLQLEHGETLSCPCSSITVPYNNFVSNIISFHPVCSSVFVNQQWIEALYLQYASTFLVMDFRTTASAQFELLAALCTISRDTVSQALIDLNNTQLITTQLLKENEVQSHINGSIQLIRTNIPIQVTSPIRFLQIATRSNFLVSALNTNAFITLLSTSDKWYYISADFTYFFNSSASKDNAQYGSPCHLKESTTPAGFYSLSYYESALNHQFWPRYAQSVEPTASARVDGFFGGCTPLDALLASTFDCLYNISCLEVFVDYFPGLNQTNLNWTSTLPSSNHGNTSLNDRLSDLFVENWSTNINYTKYFNSCAPISCTYIEKDHNNFSYTITLLISLYGGVTIILRTIAALLVNVSSKVQRRLSIPNVNIVNHVTTISKFTRWVKHLNLFKSVANRTATDITQQRITTYAYLILLTGSILTLLMLTSLVPQMITVTESNPLITTYKTLRDLYSDTLNCPCTNVSIPHYAFLSLFPTLHQVCSSDFISENWITLLWGIDIVYGRDYSDDLDAWRGLGMKHFQLLSIICQLANRTINEAVNRFHMQSFITSNVLIESDFYEQLNSTFNQFNQSLIVQFDRLVNTVHLFTQIDQPYTTFDNAKLIITTRKDKINDEQPPQSKFNFTGMKNAYPIYIDCNCATDLHCHKPIVIDNSNKMSSNDFYVTFPYTVPGMNMGCFTIDSLLLSTLECYYSDVCLFIKYYYLNKTLSVYNTDITFFYIRPLTNNLESSRFPPNTPLSTIVKTMMIEQWNLSVSFDRYYEACKPTYCTYSYSARTISFIELIVKLVSTVGGLIIALRIITPRLVEIVSGVLKLILKRQKQAGKKSSSRPRMVLINLCKLLHAILFNLNIFSLRNFGNNIDRDKAKRLCQWATRLYIVLFMIGLCVLAIYTVIEPETLMQTFLNPTLETYDHLMRDHSSILQCPCSSISTIYERFIKIKPVFHQVCSSPFASNQWRINITANLVPDLSVYTVRDYRRFISAHLQFLSGLCNISIQSVDDTINQFLSAYFITAQLLPRTTFHTRITSLTDQSKSNAPTTFTRLLTLIQATNHGNAIISAFGTNFEYIFPWYNLTQSAALLQAVSYDNGCSCASDKNCTTQAGFTKSNLSEIIPINGLKMGCTPSQSFLASTLECFFNISCINLIQEQMINIDQINIINIPEPLSANLSRFSMNTIINDLVQNLFIEKWLTTINYTAYFNQCAPRLCFYTYVQQLKSLYTLMVLLGLCGGLSLVLQWVSPNIVYLLAKAHQWYKKRRAAVRPASISEVAIIENVSVVATHNDTGKVVVDSTLVSTPTAKVTNFCPAFLRCLIFGFIMLIIMIVAIIVTSIYFARQKHIYIVSATRPTSAAISTTADTIVSTATTTSRLAEFVCKLTFQSITSYDTGSDSQPASVTVRDFNSDGHLDLAVANFGKSNVGILLGNGNGTFGSYTSYSTGNSSCPRSIAVGDLNNDGQLDLAIAILCTGSIGVLLGKDNGTFGVQTILPTVSIYSPVSIVIDDFNDDNHLDLIIANEKALNIGVLLGKGDGTFRTETMFSTGVPGYPNSIAVGDYNKDGSPDLAISNGVLNNVAVLLNNGNGYFGVAMTFLTGSSSSPSSIAATDFNNDNRLDLAVANLRSNTIAIMLGKSNTAFETQMTFSTGSYSYPNSIVIRDFNIDGHLDIAISNSYAHNVGILLGIGNGSFLPQMTFSTGAYSVLTSIASGDFNEDGKLDLVITDKMMNNVGILLNTCDCCVH